MSQAPANLTLRDYTAEHFESLIGHLFVFDQLDGESIELELLEVTRSRTGISTKLRVPFSLLFALRRPADFGSGSLRLKRDGFEPCDWFVNRVTVLGGNPGSAYCEAVFA